MNNEVFLYTSALVRILLTAQQLWQQRMGWGGYISKYLALPLSALLLLTWEKS